MIRANLHPAYVWDCEDCGTENFERAITFEGSPEELAELKEVHGVEPWEAGEFTTYPVSVICDKCGHIFESACADEEEEDEYEFDE